MPFPATGAVDNHKRFSCNYMSHWTLPNLNVLSCFLFFLCFKLSIFLLGEVKLCQESWQVFPRDAVLFEMLKSENQLVLQGDNKGFCVILHLLAGRQCIAAVWFLCSHKCSYSATQLETYF